VYLSAIIVDLAGNICKTIRMLIPKNRIEKSTNLSILYFFKKRYVRSIVIKVGSKNSFFKTFQKNHPKPIKVL